MMTHGWDTVLKGQINRFPDGLFALRLSENKHRQSRSLMECCHKPENYGIYSRRWIELAEGLGEIWGSDTWNELIHHWLKRCGITRSVPFEGIRIDGEGSPRNDLLPEQWDRKCRRILAEYAKLNTRGSQENFYRLAQKMAAHLWAGDRQDQGFVLQDNLAEREIVFLSSQGVVLRIFPYGLDTLTWLSIIVSQYREDYRRLRGGDPGCFLPTSFAPLSAVLRQARREVAEAWTRTPLNGLETAYEGTLGEKHRLLLSSGIRDERLSLAERGLIEEIEAYLSGGFDKQREEAFVACLEQHLKATDPRRLHHLLAMELYRPIDRGLLERLGTPALPEWMDL